MVGGLVWAGACTARVAVVPGEWRMSAHTNAGDMHYSACVKGRHFGAQILRQEGSHCQMVGPVIVQGALMTVTEDCLLAPPGSRNAINIRMVAHLQILDGGRRFTGTTQSVIRTALGNITEREQISGVRTGVCTAR